MIPAAWAASAESAATAPLSVAWTLPFAGLLLSIALMPLAAQRLWHQHYGKVALLWALAFLLPYAAAFGLFAALHEAVHALLVDYLPFIALLLALYTVTGGIRLTGRLRGTPGVNTLMLLIGTLAASVMGTTGAAMLLIRPLIRANRHRPHNVHVFVFFIFLVGNLGGSLTPLGDPPLFIGFMEGVPFFWPTRHLLAPTVIAAGLLLAAFYVIDRRLYHGREVADPMEAVERLGLEGKRNLGLLAGIVAIVILGGVWNSELAVDVFGVGLEVPRLVGTALLLAIAALSWRATDRESRRLNEFTWGAMVEVAILFAAMFVTIAPALAIVQAGAAGPAAPLVAALEDGGRPNNAMFFWATGLLSGFLDNAPTYLLFFNFAGGDPARLVGELGRTLQAVSAGAVFFGALTYVGNAPNLMVRAVAERNGIRMPGFFGYMVWSVGFLFPIFALLTVLFFW